MVFSNLVFLYLFLPLCILLYFVLKPIRAKNTVLLVFSLLFYAWGEPVYLFLMVAMAAVNWGAGLLLGQQHKKLWLVLSVVLDLGALVLFKYAGLLVQSFNDLTRLSLPVPQLALPIGISFYTFQALTYTLDVWKGRVQVQRSFWKFLLYLSLFPQLIAGPIVRYNDVEAALSDRTSEPVDIFYGMTRFCMGLAKKVLLADYCGKVASSILDGNLAAGTTVSFWLGLILYSFEIYFDFSGYSDMAIGMGRIFGFRYPENFDLPYISRSITEFWRRWHISLGTFFRDYVYIPLGGNRRRQYLNMAIVWALTGLWHGASWNFLLWGLYFFVILAVEKALGKERLRKIPAALRHVITLLLIVIGWDIFYFTDFTALKESFRAMIGLTGSGFCNTQTLISLQNSLPLLALCVIGSTKLPQQLGNLFGAFCTEKNDRGIGHTVYAVVTYVFDLALLVLSTIALVGSTYNAFLYFRF